MLNKAKQFGSALGLASLGALASLPAHAVDIIAATTELNEGKTNVIAIGAIVLVVAVTIAVFKYVRKAF
jgi:Inovirus Coat protein B